MPNMLQDLQETTHGYPGVFDESGGQLEQGAKKWDSILAEMIHLLREANEDTCEMKNPFEEQYDRFSEECE